MYVTNSTELSCFSKSNISSANQDVPVYFFEPQVLFPCSQEPVNSSYSEPD
jgi:hypothetical protein